MKRSLFAILFAVIPMVMSAQELLDDVQGSKIEIIKKAWRDRALNMNPEVITPGIHEFMSAFSKEYGVFEAIKVMAYYLKSPNEFKPFGDKSFTTESVDYNFSYTVHDNPRYGYMSCYSQSQFESGLQCCYWKRKNGHRLVAVYLGEEFENPSFDEHLLMFYDYNPANHTMTPETAFTDMVEKKISQFDSWTVTLPEIGKNIIVIGYTFTDDDCAVEKTFTMQWDGQNFKFK